MRHSTNTTDVGFWDSLYLHRLTDRREPTPRYAQRAFQIPQIRDWARFAYECQSPGGRDLWLLAYELGVTRTSLSRLGVGRFGPCWTFPHEDGTGRVCGVHLRAPDGRKPYVRGSRPGVALPSALGACDPLIVTEGESDCAAALSLGFDAVARPGCGSSHTALMNFVRIRRPASMVVFADNDEPGQRGARELAAQLARVCLSVRIASPPMSAKDLRAWQRLGATRGDVLAVIAAAPHVQLTVSFVTSRKTAR